MGKQEQDGESPTLLHWELGPQGDGTQGSTGVFCTGTGGWAFTVKNQIYFQRLLRKI